MPLNFWYFTVRYLILLSNLCTQVSYTILMDLCIEYILINIGLPPRQRTKVIPDTYNIHP